MFLAIRLPETKGKTFDEIASKLEGTPLSDEASTDRNQTVEPPAEQKQS